MLFDSTIVYDFILLSIRKYNFGNLKWTLFFWISNQSDYPKL